MSAVFVFRWLEDGIVMRIVAYEYEIDGEDVCSVVCVGRVNLIGEPITNERYLVL